MVFTLKFYVVLGSTVFSLHINIWFWVILDLQSHLNIFSLRNIVSVEIVQKMRLAIFGIDQLRKISFLIFLKHVFVTGVRYLRIFTSEQHIPRKIASFCAERRYADLREQCNNMGVKMFRKVFLVSDFFQFD